MEVTVRGCKVILGEEMVTTIVRSVLADRW